ncbi:Cytoplasmic tRNA 2-thiolation protein 2, partial [Egretta garzetta]
GFMDNRHGDVMVVRPMREYMAKEIAFYNHFFNVPTVIVPPLLTKRREKPSIHRLMERFLLGLQEDFPSTISTVYRYGIPGAGAPRGEGAGLGLLCLCALDIDGGEWGERMPRQRGECAGRGVLCQHWGHCTGTAEGPCPRRAESSAALIPLLCYSCRLTFKELGPLATLPPYVRAEAQRR